MRDITLTLDRIGAYVLMLGRVGENRATRVTIDMSSVIRRYPDAIGSITVKQPNNKEYPAVVTQTDGMLTWVITDADIGDKPGTGEAQITVCSADGTIIKTAIATTRVTESLGSPKSPAPDPVKGWVANAEEVLADVERSGAAAQTIADEVKRKLDAGELKGEPGRDGIDGKPGKDGATGAKGDPFVYADFTPEQLAGLTRGIAQEAAGKAEQAAMESVRQATDAAAQAAVSASGAESAKTAAGKAQKAAESSAGGAAGEAQKAQTSAVQAASSAAYAAEAGTAAGEAQKAAESAKTAAAQSEQRTAASEANVAQAEERINTAVSGAVEAVAAQGKASVAAVTAEGDRVLGTIPADYTTLSNSVSQQKDDLSNKITKFYASNLGEIHITDSDNGKIQDMMIYGKSSQDGTPTLENPVEIKSVVNPVVKLTNEDGLEVQSVTLNNITLNAIPVSSGGNVTINGQQYIADYVDVEQGKIVKMCGREALNTKNARSDEEYRIILDVNNSGVEDGSIVCLFSTFKWVSWETCVFGHNIQIKNIKKLNGELYTGQELIKLSFDFDVVYPLLKQQEINLTTEQIQTLKALATYYPTTNISINSEQLDGYTVFNYPISMQNGWNYVKQQLNDNRDYIYDMDTQSAEAYVNSEYAVALTELEV